MNTALKKQSNRTVRENFKSLRQAVGSQREVGNSVGVSEVTVRHIENGYLTPSAKLMAKFSRFFNTTVEELFPDLFEEK